ncbi:hypothetical protein [Corynebacterium sp.]|uniref:hypothetical protein n=1 Tax=Corynebacterium sp. TaxID=1720 RepID=UPI003B3A0C05
MTCLTILTLQVPAGRGTDVVDYYETAGILAASGATSTRLGLRAVPGDETDTVVVIAEWSDPSAYQDWQADPVRDSFSAGILASAGAIVSATSDVFEVA